MKDYKLIPFSEIDDEARNIACAWIDKYGNMGIDIKNRHKLASDIMNYHRSKLDETESLPADVEEAARQAEENYYKNYQQLPYSMERGAFRQGYVCALTQYTAKDKEKDELLRGKEIQIEDLKAELERAYYHMQSRKGISG